MRTYHIEDWEIRALELDILEPEYKQDLLQHIDSCHACKEKLESKNRPQLTPEERWKMIQEDMPQFVKELMDILKDYPLIKRK